MDWKIKTDDNENVVLDEKGNVILISEDGAEERPHNAADSQEHLNKLRKENQVKKDQLKALEKSHGDSIATLQKEKETLEERFKDFEDVVGDPDAARRALDTVASLDSDQANQEEVIVDLKRKHKQATEDLQRKYEGDGGLLTVANDDIDTLKKRLVQQRFLPAWTTCDVINEWRVTPTEAGLNAEFGSYIQEDGSVVGHDGEKLMAFEVGEPGDWKQDSPASDPVKILKHLLETHPQRDTLRLSKIPQGSGVGGSESKGDHDKFFDPESKEFNKSKQLGLYRDQREEYERLRKKYK